MLKFEVSDSVSARSKTPVWYRQHVRCPSKRTRAGPRSYRHIRHVRRQEPPPESAAPTPPAPVLAQQIALNKQTKNPTKNPLIDARATNVFVESGESHQEAVAETVQDRDTGPIQVADHLELVAD